MKRVLLLAPILLAIVAGCKKEFKKEDNAPVITFLSPVEGGVYTAGDTVPVKAVFNDDTKVQAYSADVNKFVYASSIFTYSKTTNSNPASLDTFMVIPSAFYGNYQFVLYCQDPYGNFTTKSANFMVELP